MGLERENGDRQGMAELLGKMADGFGRLVTQHVTLAKLELAEDARAVGQGLGRAAVFVPFVLMGYALLCGALVAALSARLGWVGAFALVGGANLALGGGGLLLALRGLRGRSVMGETLEEFRNSITALEAPRDK